MKHAFFRIRFSGCVLLLAFLVELPFGLVLAWDGFVRMILHTPLWEAIYALPSANLLRWSLDEGVLIPVGLFIFPAVWILLMGVVISIFFSTGEQTKEHVSCVWAIGLGVIFPLLYIVLSFMTFWPSCLLFLLSFIAFHFLLVRIFFLDCRRTKKKQPVNPEIPTEPAGK